MSLERTNALPLSVMQPLNSSHILAALILIIPYGVILLSKLNLIIRLIFVSCIQIFALFLLLLLSMWKANDSFVLATTFVFNTLVWFSIFCNASTIIVLWFGKNDYGR